MSAKFRRGNEAKATVSLHHMHTIYIFVCPYIIHVDNGDVKVEDLGWGKEDPKTEKKGKRTVYSGDEGFQLNPRQCITSNQGYREFLLYQLVGLGSDDMNGGREGGEFKKVFWSVQVGCF